ncbi:MAG: hypothetical protein ACREU7_04975, partial [Burkholderiales bacterium]
MDERSVLLRSSPLHNSSAGEWHTQTRKAQCGVIQFKERVAMKKLILTATSVLVVGGGITLFVLDNTLFAPVAASTAVPVAPTLAASTQPAGPTEEAAIDAEGTTSEPIETGSADAILYQIDPAQSEVRYEVGETFFQDNRFALAIGTTQGVAGELLVAFAQPANT